MKRRGVTIVEVLVVVVLIAILTALLWPMVNRSSGNARRTACQNNLRQIGLALQQYSQDYNARLPLIHVHEVSSRVSQQNPYGWAGAIYPYLPDNAFAIYQCPSEESSTAAGTDAVQAGFTDYWFNTNLSGVELKKVIHPATTLLLGDGNDGADLTDARYNRNSLPLAWLKNSGSPARRHLDGANYAFADGHVKFYRPKHIKNTRSKASDLSFAFK